MSNPTSYRAHLLKVLAQEFITQLEESQNWAENAKKASTLIFLLLV